MSTVPKTVSVANKIIDLETTVSLLYFGLRLLIERSTRENPIRVR